MFKYWVLVFATLGLNKILLSKQLVQAKQWMAQVTDSDSTAMSMLHKLMLSYWPKLILRRQATWKKFSGAFNMFCASHAVTSKLEKGVPKPKLTTIQEHFRKMLNNRRTENRTKLAASGIAEKTVNWTSSWILWLIKWTRRRKWMIYEKNKRRGNERHWTKQRKTSASCKLSTNV